MTAREMRGLLAILTGEAAKTVERPAQPRNVMEEFCRAMTVRTGRPIQLLFRAFPDDIPVSGLRLDCQDRSIIVVEERAVPEAQLVILGHELWHEEKGDCGHGAVSAAARSLTGPADPAPAPEVLERAAAQILAAHEVPRETLVNIAARAASGDDHEVDAELFGLYFGCEVRTWIQGRYAQGPVSAATLEGRINLTLSNRPGRIL